MKHAGHRHHADTFRGQDQALTAARAVAWWTWTHRLELLLTLVAVGSVALIIFGDWLSALAGGLVLGVLAWARGNVWHALRGSRVKRSWTRAVIDSGAAPLPTERSRRRPTFTGPRATRARVTPLGEVLRVKVGRGSSIDELTAAKSRLESCLKCEVRIRADRPVNGMATVVLVRSDPFKNAPPTPWPLLKAEQTSVHDPMPIGVDEEGNQLTVTWKPGTAGHTLICGQTGSGKSALGHAYIAHTALDPTARLVLLDPNYVQFSPWEACAAMPVIGPNPLDAVRALEAVQRVMNTRFEQMRQGRQWKASRGDPTYTIVIDELSSYFSKHGGDKLATALLDIIQRGRATGIRIIAIALRPSAEIMSTDVRAQFPHRVGLRVDNADTTRMIFGHTNSPAHEIEEDGYEGVGYLGTDSHKDRRFRAYWLTMSDVEQIAERASAHRLDHELELLAPPPTPPTQKAKRPDRSHGDRARLAELLPTSRPGLSRTELEQLMGSPYRQWKRVLDAMAADGVAVRDVPDGGVGPGRPARWRACAPPAREDARAPDSAV